MSSSYKDYVVPMRSNTLSTWLETIIITLAAMLLGYLYSPADPLLVKTDFPWMIFAPLLVSLRYGFLPGLLSASLILAGLLISNLVLQESLSTSYLVGMLLVTFLAGEFRDTWHKKITALHVANEYRQYRLDDFTRSYRLLKVSHDDLELRTANCELRAAVVVCAVLYCCYAAHYKMLTRHRSKIYQLLQKMLCRYLVSTVRLLQRACTLLIEKKN